MGAPYLLGIDLGTTTCRAAVFDLRGRQIGASSLETAARYPRPTWAEVDPRVWWEGTVRVLRQTLGAAGVDPRAIAGVGLTGLMHAPVLVDAAGEAVTPAMLWMDQRCAPQSARLERAAPAGRFGTSLSAAKLRWLADEQPRGPGPRRPLAVAQGLSAPAPHRRRSHRPQRRRGHGALPASGRGLGPGGRRPVRGAPAPAPARAPLLVARRDP